MSALENMQSWAAVSAQPADAAISAIAGQSAASEARANDAALAELQRQMGGLAGGVS